MHTFLGFINEIVRLGAGNVISWDTLIAVWKHEMSFWCIAPESSWNRLCKGTDGSTEISYHIATDERMSSIQRVFHL
jgi:hypothetical protein